MNIRNRIINIAFCIFLIQGLNACQSGNLNSLEEELSLGALDITSITVTAPAAINDKMPTNETLQFIATGIKSDGSTVDITTLPTVSWSISDPNIATLSSTGLLSSNTIVGSVTASASISTISGSKAITITDAPLSSIAVTDYAGTTPLSIPICNELQLKAVGTYTDSGSGSFEWDITNKASWAVGDNSVGFFSTTVSGLLFVASNVSPLPTSTIVTATLSSVPSSDSSININANLSSIVITPETSSVTIGSKVQLTATGVRNGGLDNDITALAAWTSGSANATVTSDGEANGVAVGIAPITATCGNVPATVNVTVVDSNKLERIQIKNKTSTVFYILLAGGEVADIVVEAFKANSPQPEDITDQVTWEIFDMGNGLDVFSLDKSSSSQTVGRVTALKLGTAGVKVSFTDPTVTSATSLFDDIVVRVTSTASQ